MKSLLVYLKGYKKETILAPLFKMLEACFELFVPLVVAAIIDHGIHNKASGDVFRMCGLLLFLAAIGLVCSVTAQFFAAKAAAGFAKKLRHALFSHIQNLSFAEMDVIGTSTLITRMTSDINQVQSGVNLVLRLFLRSPFIVFGAMIMAFTVNVQAAFIFVVVIPLLSVVVFGIMFLSMPLYQKVQGALDQVLGVTRENLTGVRVLRAFGKEEQEQQRFTKKNQILAQMQMMVGRISALMNPVTYIIINGGIIALIYSGAIQVDSGILTQGQVIALINYMSQILVELIKLANLIISVTKAWASGNRIADVFAVTSSIADCAGGCAADGGAVAGKQQMDVKGSRDEALTAGGLSIAFSHVGLCYKNAGAEALSNLHFYIEPGETVGIIGGTGSGKSSLVHLIPRFYDATRGNVLLDGIDVREIPLEKLREQVGFVLQRSVLFQGTIRENLQWGKKDATEEEMWQALEVAQAREFVEQKEKGLDAWIEQGGKNLSGGQQQRLAIARAVIKKPKILILDDSASALDYATDLKLRQAIRKLDESITVCIVSQRAASIRYADRILVMEDGRIAGQGTHEELLASCEVYKEIYESQFTKEEREGA